MLSDHDNCNLIIYANRNIYANIFLTVISIRIMLSISAFFWYNEQRKRFIYAILTLSIMIANELKNMIEQENLKEGDKLPSERELCEKLNVQRLTLRSGLRILMQEGIIISKQRSGYYVNKPRIVKNVLHLESTSEAIFEQGLNMKIKILNIEKKKQINNYQQSCVFL